MKTTRFRHSYRSNASRLHKKVGEILRNSELFGDFEVYQEYPVNRVNANYPNGRHHFDWVIPRLKLVTEAHGKQHFLVTAWDGDWEKAEQVFIESHARDKAKKDAALDAGYAYIMIPYYDIDRIDDVYIARLIKLAKLEQNKYTGKQYEKSDEQLLLERLKKEFKDKKKKVRTTYLQSEEHKQQLEKAREYRKKEYRRQKDLKKERERLENE